MTQTAYDLKASWFVALFLLSTLLFSEARAQSALEEVIVTATKRGAAGIQDIPLSVQAFSEERLRALDVLEFEDYFRQVPGLHVEDGGPGDKRFIIRGINARGAGAVGVYFDEVVVTDENADNGTGRQADIKLFDVERVEVLRGPQGTTFGSSSMTGTIRIIPNAPVLNELSADVGAGVSSSKESSDIGWKVDGSVNIPLVEDRLAIRISGMVMDKPGYVDNRFAKDDNNDETEALRGMLRWEISDELSFDLMAMMEDQATNARPFYNDREAVIATNPNFTGTAVPGFQNVNLSRAGFDDEFELYNAKFNWTKQWGTFTATSSIYDRDSLFDRDSSVAIEILSRGALKADGSGRSMISQFKQRELNTNEFRFASSWESNIQALMGFFWQIEDRRLETNIPRADSVTGLKVPEGGSIFGRASEAEIDEKALFTEWTADVDKFTLTAGARVAEFNIENQDFAEVNFGGAPGPGAGPLRKTSETAETFKLNVAYRFTEDSLTYFQVAEGYRSGGANNTAAGALVGVVIPEGFQSDSLVNYELGFKGDWLDGTLITNGSVYYIDWSDIQTVQQARAPSGVQVPYVGNAGSADITGFELEVQSLPAEGLKVNGGINLLHARFTEDFPNPADGLDGDRIPYVPEITLNLDVRYERPVGSFGMIGFVSGDWSYTGKQYNFSRPTNLNFQEIDPYNLLNLRIGVDGDDWSAMLSLENALDEDETVQYIYDFLGPPPPHNPDGLVRPWPRTLSFVVRKSFDFL